MKLGKVYTTLPACSLHVGEECTENHSLCTYNWFQIGIPFHATNFLQVLLAMVIFPQLEHHLGTKLLVFIFVNCNFTLSGEMQPYNNAEKRSKEIFFAWNKT